MASATVTPAPSPPFSAGALVRAVSFVLLLVFAAGCLRAGWRDDVGYTRLLQTFTSGVPTSVSAGLTQAEAPDENGNFYLPDPADTRFAGKTFINKSTGSGISGHATGVGSIFYGIGSSLIPGTAEIDVYNANDWINSLPYAETRRVQNHSWVVHTLGPANPPETTVPSINARLDFMVNQYGVVCVAGVNNGYSTTLPYFLCQAYNLISVGLTNGQHSAGFTAYDGAGRIKPDIVAPDGITSNSTPQVASAAGLLAQKLSDPAYSVLRSNIPRATKALLLAGATKDEFASWTRSAAQPIDTRYGAGELNVLLAYQILLGGKVAPAPTNVLPASAWAIDAVRNTSDPSTRTFFFEVPAGSVSPRFSAALVWHRAVAELTYSASLSNLSLALYEVDPGTFTLGATVQTSDSAVDNLEHIYVPDLPPGRYALQVSNASAAGASYAIAWRTLPTVTVAATTPVAREQDASAGVFTVTRTGSTGTPLLVPLAWGGSAVSGMHYAAPPASLLIPAGSASATVSVTPLADSLAQGDRTVTLAVATDYSLSAGSPANGTVTIQDKPYDAWRFARFSSPQLAAPAVSGETADPDADGLNNLLEYAFGGEPLAADAPARQPSVAASPDGHLTLTYFQPADRADLAYSVEWTADLAAGTWTTGAGVVTETSRSATSGGELITAQAVTDLAASPRQFLRLRVTRQ